jgi:hypothetical protein
MTLKKENICRSMRNLIGTRSSKLGWRVGQSILSIRLDLADDVDKR